MVGFAGCKSGIPAGSGSGESAIQGESQSKNLLAQKESLIDELSDQFSKWVLLGESELLSIIRSEASTPTADIEVYTKLLLSALCGVLEGKEDTTERCFRIFSTSLINASASEINRLRLELLNTENELALKCEIDEANKAKKRLEDQLNNTLELLKKITDAHDKEALKESTKRFMLSLHDDEKAKIEKGVNELFDVFGDEVVSLMAVAKQIRALGEV
jgi:DNA gyrase/topoisomerase IV subunit A